MKQIFLIRMTVVREPFIRKLIYAYACVRADDRDLAIEHASHMLARMGYTIVTTIQMELVIPGCINGYPLIEQQLLRQAKARRAGIALYFRQSLEVRASGSDQGSAGRRERA